MSFDRRKEEKQQKHHHILIAFSAERSEERDEKKAFFTILREGFLLTHAITCQIQSALELVNNSISFLIGLHHER